MKRIYTWFAAVSVLAIFGIVGRWDYEDSERAAAHKREIVTSAKAEYKIEEAYRKFAMGVK